MARSTLLPLEVRAEMLHRLYRDVLLRPVCGNDTPTNGTTLVDQTRAAAGGTEGRRDDGTRNLPT